MNMFSDYFISTKAVPSSDPPTMTRIVHVAMKVVLGTRAVHKYTDNNLTGEGTFLGHM